MQTRLQREFRITTLGSAILLGYATEEDKAETWRTEILEILGSCIEMTGRFTACASAQDKRCEMMDWHTAISATE